MSMAKQGEEVSVDARAVKLHDEALDMQPEGAEHDQDICPICVWKAEAAASAEPDDSNTNDPETDLEEEGGKVNTMDTIAQETHEALLAKAVQDATNTLEQENSSLNESVASLTEERDGLSEKVSELEAANEELNGELDKAQVELKAAQDRVEELEADIAKREEEAEKAEVASKRADQVRNLGLFTDEYISEKASKWADVSEEDWSERLEEWRQLKTEEGEGVENVTEIASAMKGTSEEPEPKSARRAVLGL